MTTKTKPPTVFWVAGVLALFWNLLGVIAYLSRAYMSPEAMESLSSGELELLENTPAWVTAAFAVAVWGGTLGSIFLLFRSKIAYFIFWISLIGIIVQTFYNFFIGNAMEVYGPGGAIMPVLVLLVGLLLVGFSRKAKRKGWIS